MSYLLMAILLVGCEVTEPVYVSDTDTLYVVDTLVVVDSVYVVSTDTVLIFYDQHFTIQPRVSYDNGLVHCKIWIEQQSDGVFKNVQAHFVMQIEPSIHAPSHDTHRPNQDSADKIVLTGDFYKDKAQTTRAEFNEVGSWGISIMEKDIIMYNKWTWGVYITYEK